MLFPRPYDISQEKTFLTKDSLGKAYIQFEDIGSSFAVYNLLNGKIFNGRPVEITFFDERSFNMIKG